MKKAKKIILITVITLAVLILITCLFLFIPHRRKFSSVYEMKNASVNDVIMFSDKKYEHSYIAFHNHHACYIDTDEELEGIGDGEKVSLYTRPIGIRLYSTDMMGIWTKYIIIVYANDD